MVEYSNFLKEVGRHPDRIYIIHYSSQGLYDENIDGLSPRITSIVVMHYPTRQTVSFAVHAEAESFGIKKGEVTSHLDEIEQAILERFYTFVRDRRERIWVHWNMRNITFGFEHLEHRYRTLTKTEPPTIPVEVRINLNDVLRDRFGDDYAPAPRMKNLMLLNGPLDRNFLEGAQEAEAFKSEEFIRMNSSTICKVEFFRSVIVLALRGKLRTKGRTLADRIDRLLESRVARVVAFSTSVVAAPAALWQAWKWIFPH